MSTKLKVLSSIVIFFCITFTYASKVEATVFTVQAFEQLKQKHIGKRWLMLLWSVDCPPCFKELALIEKLRKNHPELAVVLVNADADDEVANERKSVIEQFQLSSVPHFYFADGNADKSRYLIDKSWHGELPRSYFIEENGKFNGRSGLVSEALLRKWLIE